jgi:hypothetical protein
MPTYKTMAFINILIYYHKIIYFSLIFFCSQRQKHPLFLTPEKFSAELKKTQAGKITQ